MFCGFNVKLSAQDIIAPGFVERGRALYEQQKNEISKILSDYVLDDGLLSEEKIEKEWFPHYKADVFLSHSHKDKELVIAFAGWLNSLFGITSFIDSCVWGYSDDLLNIIDKQYCVLREKRDGSYTYDYSKRNNSTAHVHMILNSALMKMIDSTECLMFVNTPNSMLIDSVIDGTATSSPWIYSELLASKIIRHQKLLEYRLEPILEHSAHFDSLRVRYDISVDHLVNIDGKDLLRMWIGCKGKGPKSALDYLYRESGILNAREEN